MVELKEFNGWTIEVNEYNGEFSAKKSDKECLVAKSLMELEELIKRQNADDRHFKPIDVFRVSDCKKGRITSWVADKKDEVYFSSYAYPSDKKMSRTPERLVPYYHDDDKIKFVIASPANLAIVAKINETESLIHDLNERIKKLKATFVDPVTAETIKSQSGQDTDPKGAA